ncbi:acid phosphatase PHOa [Talaromyces stipitatus ATCC 10500]|uniref:Acid phosphatase PHOa n=1 Tax=Talaromyces stipitatus (strain ATCC 10500 / CBS 375.48 / QM 6759 / NRRL 1006) TaxID=441959 RepID=B8MFD4_TALSN|nr:acid phosphatase PHOa [Talaromyces stipitatus ATCC 10500]EED16668.1 acid phosphatase PHOa [Talaromyces stipitatus ATCC 10500]
MQSALLLLAAAGAAVAQLATVKEPSRADIAAAAATVVPSSPVSNVEGLAFKRFYQVWLENIDYSNASADANQKYLASKGITLTNFWALAHPSEPNYAAAAAGDMFAMDTDDFIQIPQNISTVVDLLDTKGISWGEYQEHLPYAGFQGFNYSDTAANDYVRKHNPLILYDSVAGNASRAAQIKNFSSLWSDIASNTVPQWGFITPNMTNDAHDTNITFASVWERAFVEKLENSTAFWNETLILLTFDESGHYPIQNKVFSVLLGGAVPKELVGTTDDTFYTHYSTLSTVQANWGLPSLGRWDCHANIFQIVSNKTGYTNYKVDTTNLYLNSSFYGPLSTNTYSNYSSVWPVPLTNNDSCAAGHGILPSVKSTWGGKAPTYNYSSPFPFDTQSHKDINVAFSRNGSTWVSGVNNTILAGVTSNSTSSNSTGSSTSSSSTPTHTGAASVNGASGVLALAAGVAFAFAL